MKSDVFMLNSDAGRMAAARYATEDFAHSISLEQHEALQLELLTEETLGMVKALVDDFYGQLWYENEGKRCEIHLQATANVNADQREELLSMSTSGRNAAAKGFMAMLAGGFAVDAMVPIWTLQTYREDLDTNRLSDESAGEAWDELEKSIVGKLADDIIVGVKGDCIEMVIVKDFGK